jgi:hypothetical protein
LTGMSTLSKLERVSLREAWKHEAGEFTPWLAEAENLSALAEALELSELALVSCLRNTLTNEMSPDYTGACQEESGGQLPGSCSVPPNAEPWRLFGAAARPLRRCL